MNAGKFSAVCIGSAAIATGASAQLVQEGGRPFTVQMTGAAERPGPGDPDGSGTARFMLNHGQGRLCYELTVSNIAPATAAHIHEADVNSPGPVVVPLAAPTDGDSSGCVEVDRELIKEIIQNPGDYYVNVHNADFGPGAVRGQLAK
jgi:hypothetical protein